MSTLQSSVKFVVEEPILATKPPLLESVWLQETHAMPVSPLVTPEQVDAAIAAAEVEVVGVELLVVNAADVVLVAEDCDCAVAVAVAVVLPTC
jgi:hypothetical protein